MWSAETKACGGNLVSALMFVPDFRRCAVEPSRLGSSILNVSICSTDLHGYFVYHLVMKTSVLQARRVTGRG